MATLRRLGSAPIFLSLGRQQPDAIGRLPISQLGLGIGRRVAKRLDCSRGELERRADDEARALLGVRSIAGWSAAERRAWKRWAPIALALPGIASWSREERRALVRIVRAKGARRELSFVHLFDQHASLRRAVARLARG